MARRWLDLLLTIVVKKNALLRHWLAMDVLEVASKPEPIVDLDWRGFVVRFVKHSRFQKFSDFCDLEVGQITQRSHADGHDLRQDQRASMEIKDTKQSEKSAISTQTENIVKVLECLAVVHSGLFLLWCEDIKLGLALLSMDYE